MAQTLRQKIATGITLAGVVIGSAFTIAGCQESNKPCYIELADGQGFVPCDRYYADLNDRKKAELDCKRRSKIVPPGGAILYHPLTI